MICRNCNKKLVDPWSGSCPECGTPVQTREGNGFFDLVGMLDGKKTAIPEPDVMGQRVTKLEQELAKQKQECNQLRGKLSDSKKLMKILLVLSAISILLSLAAVVGLVLTDGGEYLTEKDVKDMLEDMNQDEDEDKDKSNGDGHGDESSFGSESSGDASSEDSGSKEPGDESIEGSDSDPSDESSEESSSDPSDDTSGDTSGVT